MKQIKANITQTNSQKQLELKANEKKCKAQNYDIWYY